MENVRKAIPYNIRNTRIHSRCIKKACRILLSYVFMKHGAKVCTSLGVD